MTNPEPTVIHHCSGAGGGTLGFSPYFKTVLAYDLGESCVQTHLTNFPDTPCVQMDMKDVSVPNLPRAMVWTCGIPCAPWSMAGSQMGLNDPRDITRQLCGLIREAKTAKRLPKYMFFENVPPYKAGEGAALLRHTLLMSGYHYHEAIFVHANWGICQTRKRWHLIASLDKVPVPEATHMSHAQAMKKGKVQSNFLGLPEWIRFGEIREQYPEWFPNTTPTLLRGAFRRQRYKAESGTRGAANYSVCTIITDADLVPTILASSLTSMARNQVTMVACEATVDGHEIWYYRGLTELECRRAQGFPDSYILLGKKKERGGLIGRAIPPPFAEAVAKAIIECERK